MSNALVIADGTTARPRIPYFFWLGARRTQQTNARQTDNVVYLESSYIPTGTADLWRRTKSGLRAG
jgi:hypothetical protein